MKEKIYTIPVNEVFEPGEGCPLCRLRETLEERALEYIMGAAMMEPDVRMQTNEQGFCASHFSKMFGRKNRLSLALLLESRLAWVDEHPPAKPRRGLFGAKAEQPPAKSCYVCARIDASFEEMLETVCRMWARDTAFRALFAEQECFCHPHSLRMAAKAAEVLGAKDAQAFAGALDAIDRAYLARLREDVSAYCRLYDYQSGSDRGENGRIRDAVSRAIWYLTSTKPE